MNRFLLIIPLITLSSMITGADLLAQEFKYAGTATCASSNCHGSVRPRNATAVLQNEYVTWFKKGPHSKAWEVLTQEDAKKIGEHLGIAEPEKAAECLSCHSTYIQDAALHGEKFDIEDGVSCESCHGPAEKWLSSHAQRGAKRKDSIAKGMKDIFPLTERAKLCVSCHYGDEDKVVNHRLIGAGHPRLSFELDTFSIIQPLHWVVDQDYKERKGKYNSAKAWYVGQLSLALATLDALGSPTRSKDGNWPEPSLLNCFACHHSLKEDQWKKRDYGDRPGGMRLNVSSFLMVREGMRAIDPSIAEDIDAKLIQLHKAFREGDVAELVKRFKKTLTSRALPKADLYSYSGASLAKLLKQIVQFAGTDPHFQYEEAEQLAMAMASVLAADKSLKNKYKVELGRVFDALADPEAFDPDGFYTAVNEFYGNTSTS